MKLKLKSAIFALIVSVFISQAQELSSNDIKKLITTYKNDVRGPYYRIKWFCDDGSIREARDPCPDDIGGIQHASFKESAIDLRKTNHLFFADILAANKHDQFLDSDHNYSRLKQYQIGQYLVSVDDGWILRKGQFYRGAVQSEDEANWGKKFFENLLKNDDFIKSHYFLVRQALKDIPHGEDSNLAQKMRSQSKVLSDDIESFMDIRIKIHGKPEASDIKLVKDYVNENTSKLSDGQKKEFRGLIKTMEDFYAPIDFEVLKKDLNAISEKNNITNSIGSFLNDYSETTTREQLLTEIANILAEVRQSILDFKSSKDRLKALDLSLAFENIYLKEIQSWEPDTLGETIQKLNTLACASMGTGLIEPWEFNTVENKLYLAVEEDKLTIGELNELLSTARSVVEWSVSTVKAHYQEDVDTYAEFEPLAYGFIDDRVRSSVALNFGETVSEFGKYVSEVSNIQNKVLNVSEQSSVRGLNPGYAYGELVVVDGNPENIEVNTTKIYVFNKPPSDLKPVAGIMTVSEGNLVSHVQLLARNLGIPNAAVSYNNLKDLKNYHGKEVFYAVSDKGNVILKESDDMSSDEKSLFTKKERSNTIVKVPVDQIRLDVTEVINMKEVDAKDSGKLCGPKAANLGELKKLFPGHVVEGIIIPFGIFRQHMNQSMPGENKTYWEYLNDTFQKADAMKKDGESDSKVEDFQLEALDKLHKVMLKINLDKAFVSDFKKKFKNAFDGDIGKVPVFLRSDTNMEDLKEFTGAGLNLTLFNILEEDKIIEGIKRVWASAYTERSFKWRQKFLSNPENVFPSILIIPSVDVDYSGVMITKGINSGNDEDLTVAISRGAGGAVDGQSAETRLITSDNNFLLAPARQSDYNRLPKTGGTQKYYTAFETPILNYYNIKDLRQLADNIRKKIGNDSDAQAYDVEFGFKNNKLWLFQIRPFVENSRAKSSEYLASISPKINTNKKIKLTEKI